MDIYKINDIYELIKDNSYVGRGIITGKSADGKKAVGAFFIMGRSANSRNRIFSEKDFGIITEPHNAEGLYSIPVYSEPWAALIPAGDPLALVPGSSISVEALKDRDLIIPSRESRLREIQRWFPQENPQLHIACRISHMLNAFELTRKGVGIAIYPISDNHFSNDPSVVIKNISPTVTASYILIWNRSGQLSQIASRFIKNVCDMHDLPFPGDKGGKYAILGA